METMQDLHKRIAELQGSNKALMDELCALRELREVCGMYCESLPLEVRETLHRIPEIKKVHSCGEMWRVVAMKTRME